MRKPPTRTRRRVYAALFGLVIGLGVAMGWWIVIGERPVPRPLWRYLGAP